MNDLDVLLITLITLAVIWLGWSWLTGLDSDDCWGR